MLVLVLALVCYIVSSSISIIRVIIYIIIISSSSSSSSSWRRQTRRPGAKGRALGQKFQSDREFTKGGLVKGGFINLCVFPYAIVIHQVPFLMCKLKTCLIAKPSFTKPPIVNSRSETERLSGAGV